MSIDGKLARDRIRTRVARNTSARRTASSARRTLRRLARRSLGQ